MSRHFIIYLAHFIGDNKEFGKLRLFRLSFEFHTLIEYCCVDVQPQVMRLGRFFRLIFNHRSNYWQYFVTACPSSPYITIDILIFPYEQIFYSEKGCRAPSLKRLIIRECSASGLFLRKASAIAIWTTRIVHPHPASLFPNF